MQEQLAALEKAFQDYREDLEKAQRKTKPTDGLLGFGRALKDDACHDRFDERIEEAVAALCALPPSPEDAEKAVRKLLLQEAMDLPLSAEWMLRAAERHALSLISFLSPTDAAQILAAYQKRYRPWDRLPKQKEVLQALKKQSLSGK